MYLDISYFEHYKQFAYSVFNYLNGRINRFCNNIIFEVDYADEVNYTFANLRKPNRLTLHIMNIVEECNGPLNRNKIYSMIFIVIGHELTHVDQDMSQQAYKINRQYREDLERSTDYNNYNWLKAHEAQINRDFGISLDLSYYNDCGFWNIEDFKSASIEDYYIATLKNVLFRNDDMFSNFKVSVLDKYRNIFINFNGGANLLIKSDGEFCGQSLEGFIQAIGTEAGIYDHYTMNVSLREQPYREMPDTVIVSFVLSDRYINPIVFRSR